MNPVRLSHDVLVMPNAKRVAEAETIYLVGARPPTTASPTTVHDGDGRSTLVSEEAVLAVLRHLARGRSPAHSPLTGLEVVRRRLVSAGLVPSVRARNYEVGRLLDELANSELDRLRRQAGLVWRSPTDGEPAARLRSDFGHALPELEAWSALRYLYLAPEHALTLDDIAALVGSRHRRTLQRRLARGVAALTARLFEVERSASNAVFSDLPAPPGDIMETVRRVADAARAGYNGTPIDLAGDLIIVVLAPGAATPKLPGETL